MRYFISVFLLFAFTTAVIGATGASAWPDGTISASYAFLQQLVRDVVDEDIAANRRAMLHARIGRSLEAGYGDRADEIGSLLNSMQRMLVYLREMADFAAALPCL